MWKHPITQGVCVSETLLSPAMVYKYLFFKSIYQCDLEDFQFSSVAQSCPTLCDPTDWSTPGLPVHHQLLEFTQTHVHWVDGAIQLCHPLSSPSPPTFNLPQHQGLFRWVSSLHQVARVLCPGLFYGLKIRHVGEREAEAGTIRRNSRFRI